MNLFLTNDNDIQIIDGGLPLVTGLDEIRQMTSCRLQAFQGDWFLNLDLGMPYFQEILKKVTTAAQIEAIFLQEIGKIPGILDIDEFNIEFIKTTREINITFRATTTAGILDFNLLETT